MLIDPFTQGHIGPWNQRRRGPNLLVDGDVEDVGVSAWSASGVTLSKQGSAYQGAQCMRALALIATNGQFFQTVLTVGKTYRLTIAARGDGSGYPRIFHVGTGVLWAGTSSINWQIADIMFVATEATIRFYSPVTGQYTEWDSLYLSEE